MNNHYFNNEYLDRSYYRLLKIYYHINPIPITITMDGEL